MHNRNVLSLILWCINCSKMIINDYLHGIVE
jgi:hypothetical protein